MHQSAPRLATRAQLIQPFYAVDIYRQALVLAEKGRTILMCVGEPDFHTPERVIRAGMDAALRGETHYTQPLGIPPLRRALSQHYATRYGVDVDAERIVVTAGASGALMLAFMAFAEPGDAIMMADPAYPSNRAVLLGCGASAQLVPVGAETRYQLTAEMVDREWSDRTRGVMIASPSNPTGTSIDPGELAAIHQVVRSRGGVLVVDEIYHGLTYGHQPPSAASLGDDVFVVNSFSKYYCMTGWRLGWLVVPPWALEAISRMQAHFYICPAAPAQWAGVAALEPESTAIYEVQRAEMQRRRDFLLPTLAEMGLRVPCEPDGAFYVYADITEHSRDSWGFAMGLLQATGVAVTPGKDFGEHRANEFIRMSYTSSMAQLEEGLSAMRGYLAG
ncbi:MAG: pyridoxal phosphate-dependent aminotransferase [Gemmatimonadetes bacterium]|nr:pyridoxal phosphate-dependent aminotransferase [Gemmatimonadota bacterium]